jgi:hypothetical protein
MSYLRYIVLSLLIGACAPIVPATTPPQLKHTPGAFVVVTDDTFDAGVFRVDYPQSWRVVKTSIASTSLIQVVFVAPDESSITLTQTETVSDSISNTERFITLDNGVIVQVIIKPAKDADDTFNDLADQLISSIRPNLE